MQARHSNVPTDQACAGKHGDDANAAKVQVLFSLLSAGLPWSAQQPGNTQMTSLLGILLGHGMLFTMCCSLSTLSTHRTWGLQVMHYKP